MEFEKSMLIDVPFRQPLLTSYARVLTSTIRTFMFAVCARKFPHQKILAVTIYVVQLPLSLTKVRFLQ